MIFRSIFTILSLLQYGTVTEMSADLFTGGRKNIPDGEQNSTSMKITMIKARIFSTKSVFKNTHILSTVKLRATKLIFSAELLG